MPADMHVTRSTVGAARHRGAMTIAVRLVIAGYIMALTLGLLAGQWPLQGPLVLIVTDSHGLHAGDVVTLTASLAASIAVLVARR